MPPCLMAKKASSDTDLMFQFYLPYGKINLDIFFGIMICYESSNLKNIFEIHCHKMISA